MAIAGAIVLLMHCISIGRWHFLSPIQKSNPTPHEEATIAVPTERTHLLRRKSSRVSVASNVPIRTTDPWRNSLPEYCSFDRWTEPQSAARLGLPSKPHPDLEVLESISILDSCEDCVPCPITPPSLRLYAFPNTQYIGTPGLCFTTTDQWNRAERWARGGSKCVKISFWTWKGRKMVARIGLAEDEGIEVMGLEDIIAAMEKGKGRA
jgi:hypothetical protein